MSGSREKTCCGSCCTLLISVGITVLIYWAIFQPHQIRATVASAALSNLTLVSNASSAVSYHLAVNVSLYNPSKRVNIYYDTLDAELRYRDAVLGPAASSASPTEFYQRRKTGDVVKLEFDGRGVGVSGDVAGELEKEEKGEAPVSLELDVDVRVRYVFWSIKIRQKPRIRCSLSIPVKAEGPGAGAGGALASGDRCRVKY
ncbi:NDR1/HIN1-like protein 2 [Phragmites australis]|uniref:NDR1/HIN1-like protein 2 n=1 Tax=Phragmites australis TaxID=29695 RepID=UPI002D79E4A3|nr:NDR1/HIN1-like protein 2 [Phragmites australis]